LKTRIVAAGFSLVEVTLALGVVAVCLIAIFGLLPLGLQTNHNAIEQTNSLRVLSAIAADLRATPGSGAGTSQQYQINIPADPNTASGNLTLYFDEHGQVSGSLQANSRYRAVVTFNPNAAGSHGATFADIKVTWPAAATPTNALGSSETFIALNRN
jgi:uncharacterized protein (TIGR02598 family)